MLLQLLEYSHSLDKNTLFILNSTGIEFPLTIVSVIGCCLLSAVYELLFQGMPHVFTGGQMVEEAWAVRAVWSREMKQSAAGQSYELF